MAEFNVDPFADRYARRAAGMAASEVRALFAVASRPDVVSLAGGMPYVQALPTEHVLEVVESVLMERADIALQYGAGQGSPLLRERLAMLMSEEDTVADPEDLVVTTGAQQALDRDPRNVALLIQLGQAQSGARQFREAIATFTRGFELAPNDPMLYRWRGHRYLSVREFDRAQEDLTRGFRLDSTNYGILYHLGIVRFARGDFAGAADAFARAQPLAPEAGELAGATDWLWMSLARAGRTAEARATLDRRPDSLPVSNAYAQRLRLYRGEVGPDAVLTPADTGDVLVATLSFGIGNWYLVQGDKTRARQWFERSVASGGWPAFGFILSEIGLQRLR